MNLSGQKISGRIHILCHRGNKRILAIGGAVIKTAKEELKEIIKRNKVEMLIHNGGSIFHDFQQETEDLNSHSYPLNNLLENFECNRPASNLVWDYLHHGDAPENSVTRLCLEKDIPVLMFTTPGCDFWHYFGHSWKFLGTYQQYQLEALEDRFKKDHFHYLCMGSAVIHPEIFIKVLAMTHPKNFRADVVDFLDMYRPRTRVACYGTYYQMSHVEYLNKFLLNKNLGE